MNGGSRLRRAPETTVPDVQPVVSARIDLRVNDAALREIMLHLTRIQGQIRELQGYAASIPVESDIPAQLARSRRSLEQMALSSVPVLGDLYQDDLRRVDNQFAQAQRAYDSGDRLSAARLINSSRAQMSNLGEVLSIQTDLLTHAPRGCGSGQIVDALIQSLDSVLLDAGTANEKRFANVLRAARHYVAHSEVYNSQNSSCLTGRNAVFTYILQRGSDARSATAYSQAQEQNDLAILDRFERSMPELNSQFRLDVTRTVQGWADNLARLSMINTSDATVHDMISALRSEVDRVLTRLRDQNANVDLDNVREVGRRYYAQTGSEESQPVLQEFDALTISATALRGSDPNVLPGSSAWFGLMALDALEHGERSRAALAVAVGSLSRMVQGSASRIDGVFPRNRSSLAIDIISGSVSPDSTTISSLMAQISGASLVLQRENFTARARSFLRSARGEVSRRISSVLTALNARQDDELSLRRLLTMASTYLDLLINHPRANLSRIGLAVEREISTSDGELDFRLGLAAYSLSTRLNELRRESNDWGQGVARQRQIFANIISRAERAVLDGNIQNANLFLSLATMYSQTVELFGIRRNGQIQSLDRRFDDSSMVASINSLLASPSQGGLAAFATQFDQSRALFVRLDVERLRTLATSRTFGQSTITAALSAALERSNRGDLAGAFLLLGYVTEFYGNPSRATSSAPAQAEGWRYAQFSVRNSPLRAVAQRLLDTISLETGATTESTHTSAAISFVQARQRVDSAPLLTAEATRLQGVLNGTIPFVEGVPSTVGQVPLGTRLSDGTYPSYISISSIRQYEREHAADDPVLRNGQNLETLLAAVTRAAASSDAPAFRAARAAFFARFELVAGRTQRTNNIATATQSIDQSISVLERVASSIANDPVAASLLNQVNQTIEGARALRARFVSAQNQSTPLPADLFNAPAGSGTTTIGLGDLARDTELQTRIANTYLFIKGQIQNNAAYAREVDPNNTRNEHQSLVVGELTLSTNYFRSASERVLAGDFAGYQREYALAVAHQTMAIQYHSAENTLTVRRDLRRQFDQFIAVLSGPSGGGPNIGGFGGGSGGFMGGSGQVGPAGPAPTWLGQFAQYYNASVALGSRLILPASERTRLAAGEWQNLLGGRRQRPLFPDLVTACGQAYTPEAISALSRNLSRIPSSVFSVSPRSYTNVIAAFADLGDYQRQIREAVYSNGPDMNQRADQLMRSMQISAQANRDLIQYSVLAVTTIPMVLGMGGAFLGTSLISPWIVRGAILTQLGLAVFNDLEARGHISTQTWIMAGFMVATEGLGGLSATFRATVPLSRPLAEFTALELRNLTISRQLAAATIALGAGFTAYMAPSVVQQFRQGHYAEGMLNATMLLGGLAAMGVGGRQLLIEGRVLSEFQTSQRAPAEIIDAVVHEPALLDPVPSPANPTLMPPEMNPYSVEGLFNLLRRMTTATGRAEVAPMLETLPQNVRDAVNHLTEDATFMGLVERGATTAVTPQLQNVVGGFVPRPTPSGQIMFGTPRRTATPTSTPRFATSTQAWEYLTNPNNTDPAIIEQAYSALSPSDVAIARSMRRQMDIGRANRGAADPQVDPNLVVQEQNNPQGIADAPQLMIDTEGNVISVSGGSGRRPTPRRPGMRMAAQDPAPAQVPNAQPINVTVQNPPGAIRTAATAAYDFVATRYRTFRDARAARRNPQLESSDFLSSDGRDGLEATLVAVRPLNQRPSNLSAEGAAMYQNAESNLAEIVTALARDLPPPGARAADNQTVNLLRRIFTPENVRARVGELARSNPGEFADVARIMEDVMRGAPNSSGVAFEGSPISIFDSAGNRIPPAAENQFTAAELNLIVRSLEARSAVELPAARARLAELTATAEPLIREYDAAVAEARALNDPAATPSADALQASVTRLNAASDALSPLIQARDAVAFNSPLGRTSSVLGLELSSSQRARLLVDNASSIPGLDFPSLYRSSADRASVTLASVEATNPPTIGSNNQQLPMAQQSIQVRVLDAVRRAIRTGGDLDTVIFDALKTSADLPQEITSLQQFLDGPGRIAGNRSIVEFINNLRSASVTSAGGQTVSLADEFAAISVYRTRAGETAIAARTEAATIAAQDVGLASRVYSGAGAAWDWVAGHADYLIPLTGRPYFRRAVTGWRQYQNIYPALRYGPFAPSNLVHAIPALGLWVGLPIYLYSRHEREQTTLFNAGQIAMFDALARRNGVSREDVIFAGSVEGRAYLGTVSNLNFFPVDPIGAVTSTPVRLHPTDLSEVVDSVYLFGGRTVIYPSHAQDILMLGRRANDLLPRINRLLAENNQTELGRIFSERAPISDATRLPIPLSNVSAYMRQNNITTLSISDMGNLINAASVRLGAGGSTREVVIDAYLYDRRLVSYPGDPRNASDQRRQYLVQHPNAFAFTWYLTNTGFVPSSAVGSVVELLMDDDRLRGAFALPSSNVPAAEAVARTSQVRSLIDLTDNAQIEEIVRTTNASISQTDLASRVSDIRTRGLLGMTNDERNAYIAKLLDLAAPALSARGIYADPPIVASSLLEHVDINLVAPRPGTNAAQLTQIRELLYGTATTAGLFAQGRDDRGLLIALNSFTLNFDSAHPESNEVLIGNPVEVIRLIQDEYNRLKNDQTRNHTNDGTDAAASALRIARERGYVTYGLLLSIDPRFNSEEGRELTSFIRRTTVDGHGLMEWVAANAEHFHQNNQRNGPVSLLEIIRAVRRTVDARQPAGANTIFGSSVVDLASGLVPSFRHDHLWFPEEEPRNAARPGSQNTATQRATAIEQSLAQGTPRISRVVVRGTNADSAVQTLQQQVTNATNTLPPQLRDEISVGMDPDGVLASNEFITSIITNNGWRTAAGRLSIPSVGENGPFTQQGLVLQRFMTAPNTTQNTALRDYIYVRIFEMASIIVRGVDSTGAVVSPNVAQNYRTLLAAAGIEVAANTSEPAANRPVNITFTHQNRVDGMMGLLTNILGGVPPIARRPRR